MTSLKHNIIYAQNSIPNISNFNYNRNALSFIYLESNSIHNNSIKKASQHVTFPNKFDQNKIATSTINSKALTEQIIDKLNNAKVPNQILAHWFSRNAESGFMDMSVIHKRGLYNATADDLVKTSATKVGLVGLKDAGELLINSSYIFVVTVDDIINMEKVYDRQDAARKVAAELFNTKFTPVERNKQGWEGQLKGYLFKLTFNREAIDEFYNEMWVYENDDELTKTLKKAKFETAKFPITFIMEVDGTGRGAQYKAGHPLATTPPKTDVELFTELLNTGIEKCILDVERKVSDFQVKTPIYNDKPIMAKIGNKEGLKIDQRYFVVEFKSNRKGKVKAVRKGVVRAKDVMLNKDEGYQDVRKYSTFYQTSGVDIEPGMLMRQKPELGIAFSGGFTLIGGLSGGYGKMELNASKALTNGPTMLKLFGVVAGDETKYKMNGSAEESIAFYRYYAGISKGFYFARNFSINPFIAYGIETAAYDYKESSTISTRIINFGSYASINILHNVQAIGTVNVFAPFGSVIDDENNEIDGKYYNRDFFIDRKGITIDVGLRIEV